MVVGGEQRLGGALGAGVQVLDHGAGDRQAVVGARAATDLVEEDEGAPGGAAQDRGRLQHLDHEGRLPARDVVLGADAGEDAVDNTDAGRGGGHEAARPAPSA